MLRTLLGLLLAIAIAPAAWANSYNIQPGDVLQMEVLEDPSLNRSLLVLPDGTVSLPLAGAIKASGQTVDIELEVIDAGVRRRHRLAGG